MGSSCFVSCTILSCNVVSMSFALKTYHWPVHSYRLNKVYIALVPFFVCMHSVILRWLDSLKMVIFTTFLLTSDKI